MYRVEYVDDSSYELKEITFDKTEFLINWIEQCKQTITIEDSWIMVYLTPQEWPIINESFMDLPDSTKLGKYLYQYAQTIRWYNGLATPPVLDSSRYFDYFYAFPFLNVAPKETELQTIPLDRIYGDNWAFMEKEERGHYPKVTKLQDLLSGYTEVNNTQYKKTFGNIPPVPVYNIGDGYFLSEGNHRFYLSNILGRTTIEAEVTKVDYGRFLQESTLHESGAVIYEGEYHFPYSDRQTQNYQVVKEYYQRHNQLLTNEIMKLTV